MDNLRAARGQPSWLSHISFLYFLGRPDQANAAVQKIEH